MRIIRKPKHRRRDEYNGILSPRPLIPTIARRSGLRLLDRVGPFHEPSTLGYVSWMAFLVFWLVFGRAALLYFMTIGGLAPTPTQGVSIRFSEPKLTGTQVDDLIGGLDVDASDGTLQLNTTEYVVRHIRVQTNGELRIADGVWTDATREALCVESAWRGKRPVVFVSLHRTASYQDMVSAVDSVEDTDDWDCFPTVYFTSPEP